MIFYNDLENFKSLITLSANYKKIPEFYIEKDYWVIHILKKLGNSEFKEDVVFNLYQKDME